MGEQTETNVDRLSKSELAREFLATFQNDVAAAHAYLQEAYHHEINTHAKEKTVTSHVGKKVLLSARSLEKNYKRGRQTLTVLRGVDVDIFEGEFVAITGPSGSGKSTLLQLLGGLDRPSSGEVQVEGVSLGKLSDAKLSLFRRQTVGFVFQFFYLQPFLSLEKNLEVPAMFARQARSVRRQRIAELSEKVGLSDRLKHYPKELSGGQMQRAAIARALLNSPRVILADEPTGNLDSANGMAIIELFENIRRDFGTTIVIVTHDAEIARRADREIRIRDGEVV